MNEQSNNPRFTAVICLGYILRYMIQKFSMLYIEVHLIKPEDEIHLTMVQNIAVLELERGGFLREERNFSQGQNLLCMARALPGKNRII
jgi:hypothetical protein